jgi:hypothetical protein
MKAYGVLLTLFLFTFTLSLKVTPKSLEGTEFHPTKLSHKQLAIQRFLSYLTIFQTSHSKPLKKPIFGWEGWEYNVDNPQLDLPSTRYPLSFMGTFRYPVQFIKK